jgi:hypothetical protein
MFCKVNITDRNILIKKVEKKSPPKPKITMNKKTNKNFIKMFSIRFSLYFHYSRQQSKESIN